MYLKCYYRTLDIVIYIAANKLREINDINKPSLSIQESNDSTLEIRV